MHRERMIQEIKHMEKLEWNRACRAYGLSHKNIETDTDVFFQSDMFHLNEKLDINEIVYGLIERASKIAAADEFDSADVRYEDFANSVIRLLAIAKHIGEKLGKSHGLQPENQLQMHDALYFLSIHENVLAHEELREMGEGVVPAKLDSIASHTQKASQFMNASQSLIHMRQSAGTPPHSHWIPSRLMKAGR